MPQFTGSEIDLKSKAEQKVRPWARVLSPLAVPDWCFDVNGDLDWAIVEEYIVEDRPDKGRYPHLSQNSIH